MASSINKAELRELLERLGELADEDPQRRVPIRRDKTLTPDEALSKLENLCGPNGPVISVIDGGSIVSRINRSFPWDGPEEQVEFELGEGSLTQDIRDIRLLIENWNK